MTAAKFAVSFSPDLYSAVQEDAQQLGTTVSQWLAEAAKRRLKQKFLAAAIEDWEAEFGTITEADMDAVKHLWRD